VRDLYHRFIPLFTIISTLTAFWVAVWVYHGHTTK
jgi:hypothetical protein